MSVRAQRERHEQYERERAVLRMREAVVCAIAPAHVRRVGTSAVQEAVDEALAQIVAAGGHLGEPEAVKALWITCARRRVIDEQRSAESRHRDATRVDEPHRGLDQRLHDDLTQPTEDGRQEWRIREILGVLRGDQRLWAEAWYDEVLSGSRPSGAQPRGLGDALGWSPSKTKSVSRRARARMAAFIDDRANGVICEERRALLDAFIMTGRRRSGHGLDDARYETVLFHLAGCETCYAAWHMRRRSLPARCGAVLVLPIDGLASAAHALSAKATCLAMSAYGQASSLLARAGIGGAAAAGGGAVSIGAKATAVCVGVVCAATAGGEIAGVIPPIPLDAQQTSSQAGRPQTTAQAPAVTTSPSTVAVVPPPSAPAGTASTNATPAVSSSDPDAPDDPVSPQPTDPVVRETPGDIPAPRSTARASGVRVASNSRSRAPPVRTGGASNCAPGSLGC